MVSIPFLKSILPKKSVEELKQKSRLDYESATERTNKMSLGFRLRLANRAKVNLEKTFLDGARLTEKYESLKEIHLAQQEPINDLIEPKLDEPYKLIETDNGTIISFIPEEYAKEIFELGCSYQKCLLDADKSTLVAQGIFEKICVELRINKEITVLDFLTSGENNEQFKEDN
jgi:hypothetical protein